MFLGGESILSQKKLSHFCRKIEYHLLGVFLQQTILIIVGFMTFLFEVTNFQDRVMVSLTLMLVIATISTSIQQVKPFM